MKNTLILFAGAAFLFGGGFAVYAQEGLGGGRWTSLPSGVTNDLNDVECVSETTCYAVGGAPFIGGNGVVLKTVNGGSAWARQSIPMANPLRGISCPSAEVCYAAGDGGALLKTTNGGASWARLGANTRAAEQYYWDIATYDVSHAVAVGNAGTIFRTADGGANWTRVDAGTSENLHRVHFANAAIGWIVGGGGKVLKTINGGTNWLPLTSPQGTGGLFDVSSYDGVRVWIGGDVGRLLKSVNGGLGLTTARPDTISTFRAVEFTSDAEGFAAGGGAIKKTADGGATWANENIPQAAGAVILRGIDCPSASVCYIVGDDGMILRRGTPRAEESAGGSAPASAGAPSSAPPSASGGLFSRFTNTIGRLFTSQAPIASKTGTSGAGGTPEGLFKSTLSPQQKQKAESLEKKNSWVKSARGVSIPSGALNQSRLLLNLLPNKELVGERKQFTEQPNGTKIWKGNVEGKPGNKITLVSKGNITMGNIRTEEGIYEIRYAGNGAHTILFVDPKLIPEEAEPKAPPTEERPTAVYTPPPPSRVADAVVDVAVIVTLDAYEALGEDSDALQAFLDLMAADANMAYEMSGIGMRVRLARWAVVNERLYDESRDLETDLDALSDSTPAPSNRLAPYARDMRDEYDADILTLLVSDGGGRACGIGWLMDESNERTFADLAYNVVDVDCVSNYSFIHELGHNMGLGHDRDNHDDDSPPRYSYGYGYQDPQERFRTIMSYDCPHGCQRIPFFSNPDMTYVGIPFGTATEDNTRALQNARFVVANYSEARDSGSGESSADAAADFARNTGIEAPSSSAPGAIQLFFKNTSRAFQSFLTFDKTKKAELELRFANEKLLEVRQLASAGKSELAANQLKKFSESVGKAEGIIKNLGEKDGAKAAELKKRLLEQEFAQQKLLSAMKKEFTGETKEKFQSVRDAEAGRLARAADGAPPEELKKIIDKASQKDIPLLERVAEKTSESAKKLIGEKKEILLEARSKKAAKETSALGETMPAAGKVVPAAPPVFAKPIPVKEPTPIKEPVPTFCAEEYAPVCGKDGKTYSNKCFAAGAKAVIAYEGTCKSEPILPVSEKQQSVTVSSTPAATTAVPPATTEKPQPTTSTKEAQPAAPVEKTQSSPAPAAEPVPAIEKEQPAASTGTSTETTTTPLVVSTTDAKTITAPLTITAKPVTPDKPKIISFTVSPTAIKKGQTATLSWSTSDATAVTLAPTKGTLSASGTMTVKPTLSTTYTITATNAGGSVTSSTTVTVK